MGLQLPGESATLAKQRFERLQGMTEGGSEGGDAAANLISFPEARRERLEMPISFDRRELDQILRLYGRMVAANEWRDYAIDHLSDRAVFSVFRRASWAPSASWRRGGASSSAAANGRACSASLAGR